MALSPPPRGERRRRPFVTIRCASAAPATPPEASRMRRRVTTSWASIANHVDLFFHAPIIDPCLVAHDRNNVAPVARSELSSCCLTLPPASAAEQVHAAASSLILAPATSGKFRPI
jgi:hypothetical protein